MKFLTRLRFGDDGMTDLSGTVWENQGVTFDVPGRFGGRAARFDGMSYLKTTNDEFDFGFDRDFTIAMWIKYRNAKNYCHQTLLGSHLGWHTEYVSCTLYSSTYGSGVPTCATGLGTIVTGSTKYDDNMWHHIALVRRENVVKLFMDGKLDSVNMGGQPVNFAFSGTTMIGWEDVRINDTYGYVGEMDDICVIKDNALWTANFVPPSTYLKQSSFLYQRTNGQVYGMK